MFLRAYVVLIFYIIKQKNKYERKSKMKMSNLAFTLESTTKNLTKMLPQLTNKSSQWNLWCTTCCEEKVVARSIETSVGMFGVAVGDSFTCCDTVGSMVAWRRGNGVVRKGFEHENGEWITMLVGYFFANFPEIIMLFVAFNFKICYFN